MATISTDAKGNRTIQVFDKNRKRWAVRLGKVSKDVAQDVKRHVEHLASVQILGQEMRDATARWLVNASPKIRNRLAKIGFIVGESSPLAIGAFVREYIESRTDLSPQTIRNLGQARSRLVEHFGEKRLISTVTEDDADRYAIKLKGLFKAASSAAKIVKYAKHFFRKAVRAGIIRSNPFADVRCCETFDPMTKHYFVTPAEIEAVMKACPDDEWRLIIALSRFGGLRCPSEILRAKVEDIGADRIHVKGKGKRGRETPLFPELVPHIEKAIQGKKPGDYLVTRYRQDEANLRTQFHRIIRKAGLTPWQRCFHNMRSTRQTELERRFALHIVCAWLGNSPKVAMKHYLQVQESDFADAVAHHNSGADDAGQPRTVKGDKARKQRKNQGFSVFPRESNDREGLPAGLEHHAKTREIRDISIQNIFRASRLTTSLSVCVMAARRLDHEKRRRPSRCSRAAVTLGERGGKKGGPARAKSLTASQRSSIARKGGSARARSKGK